MDLNRTDALIRCTLGMEFERGSDEWHKAWGQVKYYLSVVNQVKF